MKLTLDNIKKTVELVKKEFPHLTFEVTPSKKSSSVYIYILYDDGACISLRVADHEIRRNYTDKEIIISNTINAKGLRKQITRLAKTLELKHLQYLFYKIKEKQNDK